MPKISAKVLYAIVGTGIAGSVSTGLYLGLGSPLTTKSSFSEQSGGASSSGLHTSASYGNSGKTCELESMSEISEEQRKQLQEELTDEDCQN